MPGSYYCIQSEAKPPHVAPQHFTSAFFTKHTRQTLFLNQPIAQVLYQPSFPHCHSVEREKSFISLLTLENFWSLQKNNSHSCYMADWSRLGCILDVPRVSDGLHLLPVLFSCHYSCYTASFCYEGLDTSVLHSRMRNTH